MRRYAIFLAVGTSLLFAAAPVSAAVTPGSAGGTQVFLESDSAGDDLTLQCVGGQTRYQAIDLLPCNVVQAIFITGNGGNDVVDLSSVTAADFPALSRLEIDGGSGTDVINGSQLGDTVTSDSFDVVVSANGNDIIEEGAQILAGAGDDLMTRSRGSADGGPGDDRFEQSSGEGPFTGGTGVDAFSLDLPAEAVLDFRFDVEDTRLGVTVTGSPPASIPWSSIDVAQLALFNGGTQTVDASRFSGSVEVDGRGGPDSLIGGPGEDRLVGGPGNDVLTGGAGFDWVSGGADNDQLNLRDNEIDRGLCGDGADSVMADAGDSLLGCESIDLPLVSVPDKAPPVTKNLKGPKKVVKNKAAIFKFASSEPGTFMCRIDKGPYKRCKSPFKLRTAKLKPGKHSFSVYAVDTAGNADKTPLTKKFSVETPSKR
jgi:hypothetical protein